MFTFTNNPEKFAQNKIIINNFKWDNFKTRLQPIGI